LREYGGSTLNHCGAGRLPGGKLRPHDNVRLHVGSKFARLAASCATACGGPSFDGAVFRNGELAFRVRGIPEAWRRLDASDALLAFRDDGTPATILINGRCGKDGDDVPLPALTHHLFLQFTHRTITDEKRLELDGREAMYTELTARLDGVEKLFSVFVLKKNGCVYDFVHIARPSSPPDGRERFVAFVEGFATIKP
jgi:hypothetical protein